jgi:Trk K+ transport system NAD-binding subunit
MFFSIPLPIPGYLSPYINVLVIAVGVLAIFKLFGATHIMDRFTAKAKEQMAEKNIVTEEKVTDLLSTHEGYGVAQFDILEDSYLADKSLKELKLKESEIQVLLIERPEGPVVTPKGTEKLKAGDTLICFGKLEQIRQLA